MNDKIVRLLLSKGADPNLIPTGDYQTPLMLACQNGTTDAVLALIEVVLM